jgi:hypothetical protein
MVKDTVLLVEPRILERLPEVIEEFHTYLKDYWNYVFYCGKGTTEYWKGKVGSYVELRELDVTNFPSSDEYSWYMKQAELWNSLEGEFVLSIQADTWIMNIAPYTIDFFLSLNKSYIGGNMSYVWNEMRRENLHPPFRNFNGGLSLRKRADMLRIIEAFPPTPTRSSPQMEADAEDVYFTIGCYRLGLPIADDEVSSHFAVHNTPKTHFFGIHQPSASVKHTYMSLYPEKGARAPYCPG